jgi:hypothetical protein
MEPQANAEFHPVLVVDDLLLRGAAERILDGKVKSQRLCEDLYVSSDDGYSIISHQYQILFTPEMETNNSDDANRMRRDYWKYMASHPAHTAHIIGALRDAHSLALTYLKWCSSGTLFCNLPVPQTKVAN